MADLNKEQNQEATTPILRRQFPLDACCQAAADVTAADPSSPRPPHLCISAVVIPCLLVASFIFYLLGSRYEHLAELAEFMLNATLLMAKFTHS